jgi:tRNA threonylcarbamoyladenosine biosynthesis protein TsaB
MNIILSIDTSDNQVIKVGLEIAGKQHETIKLLDKRKAQAVLPMIDELLKEHNLALRDISEIIVNAGPGSFIGVRVGVTIANTLGFILRIPVNKKPVGESVEPIYS